MYIALSGAVIRQAKMDMVAQNLANAQTSGFKKDRMTFADFLISQMIGIFDAPEGRAMSITSSVATDFSGGNIVTTGNSLDVALEGKGFFSLEGGRYTRRGDFRLDSDGYLVSQHGERVLGTGGPIQITENGMVEINAAGEVSVNGILIDSLKVAVFDDAGVLRKAGDDSFVTDQEPGQITGQLDGAVRQGFLETSNVDVVKEMIGMITLMREFHSYQKAIQAFDESTGKVISEIGRI